MTEPTEPTEMTEPTEPAETHAYVTEVEDVAEPVAKSPRTARGAVLLGARILTGMIGVGVAAVTIGAAILVPLPSHQVTPVSRLVTPVASPQKRVCAGPLLRLGDDAGQAATAVSSVGKPEVRYSQSAGKATRAPLTSTDSTTGVAPDLLTLPPRSTSSSLLPLLSEDTRFAQAVSMLKIAGMVEEEKGALRTSHPLLRDVVLATIPASVRKTLHSSATRVADMLGAPIEVQALHEFHAQNAFGALLLLERVALRCAARGDVAGNILALRRGLELARRELFRGELDDPMRAVLIFSRKLGEALATAGDLTDADGVLREALDMAGPSGQDRARVLGALAHVAHGRERRKEAQAYLSEALELATKSGSHELVTSLEDLRRAIAV